MQKQSKYNRIRIIITAIILVVIAVIMLLSNTDAKIDGKTLIVTGSFFKEEINIADIKSIEIFDSWDAGRRSMGMETFNTKIGTFTNTDLGQYKLCAYKNTSKFIKIISGSSGTVVFNLKTAEATQNIYNRLKEKSNVTTGA
jgi:hypothetical protein